LDIYILQGSENIVKIGQYLVNIWKKYNSLFFGPLCTPL